MNGLSKLKDPGETRAISGLKALTAAGAFLAAGCWWTLAAAAGFAAINRIKESGQLQVAVLEPASVNAAADRALVDRFAARLGAEAVFHRYRGHDALIRALAGGEVDLIAEPLAADRPLPQGLARSLPLRHADLWLVTSPFVSKVGPDLPLAVQFASDGWHQVLDLRRAGRSAALQVVPADWSREDLLARVARGQIKASLAYDEELARVPGARPRQKLKAHMALNWIVRESDRVFARRVDDFLREHGLTREVSFADAGDWPAIQERGRIRLVTLYRPETYFAWAGHLLGFEFELVNAFARAHGLGLDVVIADDAADLQARLAAGEADLGAAFLRPESLTESLVASTPYYHSEGRIVSRQGRYRRLRPPDLHDRSLLIPTDSPYRATVEAWAQAGIGVLPLPAAGPPETLVERVVTGTADFALIDEHQFRLIGLWRDDVDGLLAVEQSAPRVWAVRRDNPELLAAVNRYLGQAAAARRARLAESKYFAGEASDPRFRAAVAAFSGAGRFSPYDELVRRYANYYGFDWRLILAMVFQESRFDPNAVSRSGARGLMQLQEVAARQVGIDDLFDPQSSIHGGVRYLDWVRRQFEPDLDIRDRTWFSLAAYNGGLTHVKAARELARRQGLDSRRWFGNVEAAIKVLADPQHDPEGRFQTLDADQVVTYVSKIRDYFRMYVRLTEAPAPTSAPSPALAERSGDTETKRSTSTSMAALGLE